MIEPLYSLAGLMVGMLVGMTGVGGGSLMTPLLILLFNFHPTTAVGTDLLYASATKSVGTAVHGRHGTVDWTIVRRLATGSLPAAIITLFIVSRFSHEAKAVAAIISLALGALLIISGLLVQFRAWAVEWLRALVGELDAVRTARYTIVMGVALGFLVSLTSVGAGAIGMTVLLVLYPRAPVVRLVGSDIAHAVPLTLIAGTAHFLSGNVDVSLLLSLLIGSVPGIILGSLAATRVSERVLRPILAITLVIIGTKLLIPT